MKTANRFLALAVTILIAVSAATAQTAQEQQIFNLTNQDRRQHNLPALRWNEALARAAQSHADRMVQERNLSHQYPGEPDLMTRAAAAGAHFQAVAENIATGPSPDSIDNEWMHSPSHRANILDPHMNALGVAVIARGGRTLYAVEDFAESNEALSTTQIEQRVRELLQEQKVDASAPSAPAEQACAMGHGFPQGSNVRAIVRFETPDLKQLPTQVEQQIHAGDFKRAAVGACAPTTSQAQFTTYRIAILLY
jgi:hypothetical protein